MSHDGPTVVLVTGANSGIGRAAVCELLDRGASVVATVRSDEAEDDVVAAVEAAGTGRSALTIERLDVTDLDDVEAVVARRRPDVVVNNAGVTLLGAVGDPGVDEVRQQFEVSVIAPVLVGSVALRCGAGRVVNVGSAVATGVVPFTGWYAGAKAALDAVTEVWRLELDGGTQLVTVRCGAIDTDVWDSLGGDLTTSGDATTAGARRRWAAMTERIRPLFTDPAAVADAIAEAALATSPPPTIDVGFGSRLTRIARSVPGWARRATTRLVLRR